MSYKWDDKDPGDIWDYSLDWSSLLVEGETITESQWSVDDAALEIGSGDHDPSIASNITTVWLSGGVAGKTYKVTDHITTSRGAEIERTASIKVKEL
jgi:hypothetical protein